MVKPVCGVCNLSCGYCYYKDKPRELYPAETRFQMTPEALESFTRQYMALHPERAEFGWQGGEPMLAGREFYRRAVELQRQFGRPGQTVANALQTNGTLLDEAWCDLLAEHRFLVGLSLDGPPPWQDAFRKDAAGAGSFARAWKGLELLRARGVEFNVLVTLHRANVPHAADLYRYFVNRGVRYVQFIPILERDAAGRPAEFSCTPQQYGRFLVEVFRLWRARDVGRVSERFIDSVLHQLLFGSPASCCQAPRCANAFVLEYNGDLYACDHFVAPDYRLGNILEMPLAAMVGSERQRRFGLAKREALPRYCLTCPARSLCHGGCPKDRLLATPDGEPGLNYLCEGYRAFHTHSERAMQFMAGELCAGRPPANVMLYLAQDESAREERFGRARRNDPCPCGSGRKFKQCHGRGAR